MNNWLENRVKALEEELENSKIDFENLEMLYKNSSCKCDSLVCQNCESLKKKVHYLVKIVHKLSKGKSNFESVLASQTCVFGKVRLGFNPKNKFQTLFQKFQKYNRLKNQNNRLLHVFIACKDATQLGSVKLGNILFLKAL